MFCGSEAGLEHFEVETEEHDSSPFDKVHTFLHVIFYLFIFFLASLFSSKQLLHGVNRNVVGSDYDALCCSGELFIQTLAHISDDLLRKE